MGVVEERDDLGVARVCWRSCLVLVFQELAEHSMAFLGQSVR